MLTGAIPGTMQDGHWVVAADRRDTDPSVRGNPWLSWETGSFEVPVGTLDALIQEKAAFYRKVYADKIERKGLLLCWPTEVVAMEGPYPDDHPVLKDCGIDPDRKRYILRALVKREPRSFGFIVPDAMAAQYEASGYRRKG